MSTGKTLIVTDVLKKNGAFIFRAKGSKNTELLLSEDENNRLFGIIRNYSFVSMA
jgi:hypothetical protein